MIPSSITEAVTEYAGFDPSHFDGTEMSEQEIRDFVDEYFTEENFETMFGDDDADISGWDWSFRELADLAYELAIEARGN